MTINPQLVPVLFHGDTLFIVSHEGEPFTPVRPITNAIGIDWKSQHRKLISNQGRWTVVMMTTVTKSGPKEALCIPVRKLAAFLASIDPRKVRPEIRAKIELYQSECDDALWNYWSTGRAENPRAVRMPNPPAQKMLFDEPASTIIPPAPKPAATQHSTAGKAVRPLGDLMFVGPHEMIIEKSKYQGMVEELNQALRELVDHYRKANAPRRTPRPIPPEEIEEIRRLSGQGWSRGKIAKHLDRSTASISYLLRDGGAA